MKIPKLFKKAAAFVMAAVTALSIMPATAFAAGDIGTISFSHTYDSNGNAMRYNSRQYNPVCRCRLPDLRPEWKACDYDFHLSRSDDH